MHETVLQIVILALSIEAVLFVVVFVAYIGTLTQKNLKEAEAAEEQKKAWIAQRGLSETLKKNIEDSKKAANDALRQLVETAVLEAHNSQITH